MTGFISDAPFFEVAYCSACGVTLTQDVALISLAKSFETRVKVHFLNTMTVKVHFAHSAPVLLTEMRPTMLSIGIKGDMAN
ncbi:MAG: hypothetical protein ABS82_06245 [Rhodanobacter sp. SCN 67-45]|nr:MAG: hypothetical protein ABS82_06245 [Rhodanobacter sp. SCN 67-45]